MSTGIEIEAVELRRIELRLVTPFRTSFGVEHARDILLVRVLAGGVEGWGECVAGTAPLYSSEYTAAAAHVLLSHLVPRLLSAGPLTGGRVAPVLGAVTGHRMAKAAIEAAVLDAELRAENRSLADRLGATERRVPVGASIGITGSVEELIDVAGARLAEGYRRVKVKIEPGWEVEPVRRLRDAHGPDFGLQVDANAAFDPTDADHRAVLRALDEFDLLLVEQPFPADMLVAHAELAVELRTPICLDESLTSVAATADAVALGASPVVTIKPGRLGGHLAGRTVHDLCRAAGVPVWHGGMLETGVGRAANLALAALPGFELPADISASARYWTRDIVADPAALNGDGTIDVPSGPGIGVRVDLDFLDAVTTWRELIRPSPRGRGQRGSGPYGAGGRPA